MAPSKSALARIHIAKKELGLTENAYRYILNIHFQVDSAVRLTDRQATVLINNFKAQGWREKRAQENVKSPRYINRQMRRVVALWITLTQAGVIKDGSDPALQAYVRRQTGIGNLRWCGPDDLNIVIESLKKWAERKGVPLA
jgi:phage gp16-like protein